MGFAHMLSLGVGVRLVIMSDGWMIVFVGMGRRHVLPLTPMPEIVHHECIFVRMNDLVMLVIHDLPLLAAPRLREPARADARNIWQMTASAALPELGLGQMPLGLVPLGRVEQPRAA